MRGEKHLLLLAAFAVLAGCQPQVLLSPPLPQIFTGDLLYLNCDNITDGGQVTWYLNDTRQTETSKTIKIAAASPTDSGNYYCKSNEQRSGDYVLKVEDFVPSASLTMETGQPVMQKGGIIILKIEHENGLDGWNCSVYEGVKRNWIKLRLKDNPVYLEFQSRKLTTHETIFWCTNYESRSNQVVVRTSEKPLSLEMYPMPAVAGESLTLRCLVWGAKVIKHTIFYKETTILKQGDEPTHEIHNVTTSVRGIYSCQATFMFVDKSSGPPYDRKSDPQDVPVQAQPEAAILSEDMSCSCKKCTGGMSYRFYKKVGESWKFLPLNTKPSETGLYGCRLVSRNMRTLLSNAMFYQPSSFPLLVSSVIFFILLVILAAGATFLYVKHKRRNATVPIYEDVQMHSRGKGDDKYEPLQMNRREGEYDELQKKSGEYEALKKEGMKGEVYHTLGMEGAAGGGEGGGGEGGYEALKKEGMKEGVYHSLGMEGAAGGGGEGGYEALRKEGMKEGVYHTLGAKGEQKAGGKKDDEKESEIVEL
ncbi:uncharacterized protein LOC114437347 isoform X2 [Parambassis ranga]|uniref:Uncharacterized protein LOC114437347 isoform X2 n=1 Tax=Parambassis ranga TaxID=210632 RepID=A0A6P7ISB7_9TELE|nr:uncharacterized protein LOC114437347 isoform X2 [Parambassis ranga]